MAASPMKVSLSERRAVVAASTVDSAMNAAMVGVWGTHAATRIQCNFRGSVGRRRAAKLSEERHQQRVMAKRKEEQRQKERDELDSFTHEEYLRLCEEEWVAFIDVSERFWRYGINITMQLETEALRSAMEINVMELYWRGQFSARMLRELDEVHVRAHVEEEYWMDVKTLSATAASYQRRAKLRELSRHENQLARVEMEEEVAREDFWETFLNSLEEVWIQFRLEGQELRMLHDAQSRYRELIKTEQSGELDDVSSQGSDAPVLSEMKASAKYLTPLVPHAMARTIRLHSSATQPYHQNQFNSVRFPFHKRQAKKQQPQAQSPYASKNLSLPPSGSPSRLQSRQSHNNTGRSLGSTYPGNRSPGATTNSALMSTTPTKQMLPKGRGLHTSSSASRRLLSPVNKESKLPYRREHQLSCDYCLDNAIAFFMKLEKRLRESETSSRKSVESDESDRRRQIYKLYVPLHHRIRQYINDVMQQRHIQLAIEEVLEQKRALEEYELVQRRRVGADMLRTLRAIYRCAQRESGDVKVAVERRLADEKIRLEVQERAEAARRQREAIELEKGIKLQLQMVGKEEERERSLLESEQFRVEAKLSLLFHDGVHRADASALRRVEDGYQAQRHRVTVIELFTAREQVESAERSARSQIRAQFAGAINLVKQKILQRKVRDCELKEVSVREMKEPTMLWELITHQIGLNARQEVVHRQNIENLQIAALEHLDEELFRSSSSLESFHIDEDDGESDAASSAVSDVLESARHSVGRDIASSVMELALSPRDDEPS